MAMRYTKPQKKDIIEWNIKSWEKVLPFFDERLVIKADSRALELGARRGGLSLWLSLRGVKNIVCSDYVDNQNLAKDIHGKYNTQANFCYEIINATDIPYNNEFDLIVFKSMLGGVGSNQRKDLQIKAMEEIFKAIKPGGILMFAENIDGSYLHKFCRKHFVRWGDTWRYPSLEELKVMTNMFSKVEYRTYGFLATFGRTERQRSFLSYVDKILVPFIPKKHRYISSFVCTK